MTTNNQDGKLQDSPFITRDIIGGCFIAFDRRDGSLVIERPDGPRRYSVALPVAALEGLLEFLAQPAVLGELRTISDRVEREFSLWYEAFRRESAAVDGGKLPPPRWSVLTTPEAFSATALMNSSVTLRTLADGTLQAAFDPATVDPNNPDPWMTVREVVRPRASSLVLLVVDDGDVILMREEEYSSQV